jgi:hypothetical protein
MMLSLSSSEMTVVSKFCLLGQAGEVPAWPCSCDASPARGTSHEQPFHSQADTA